VRRRLLAALDTDAPAATLEVESHAVPVSHLDRVYWPAEPALDAPAVTKRDFLRYLVEASGPMLSHLKDRPLTLFRWPEGLTGRRVLMKHWEIRLPAFVEEVEIFSESKGHPDRYIVCNNLATLLWLGQMGALEIHAWHSRIRPGRDSPVRSTDFASSLRSLRRSIVEHPDYLLFDLDPFIYTGRETREKQPEFSEHAFARSREVALRLKALLDSMSLRSFVKTSGKTGLHVVVPLRRTLRYDAVRDVARQVGEHLARAHRDWISVDWSVDKRAGKVFIDFNMNVRGKSMTAPYSPRGLPAAPVSMPLEWGALARAHPLDYRIGTLLATIDRRTDAWARLEASAQSLEDALTDA
jgi:bifunctional non-homologous end joining protein LigD